MPPSSAREFKLSLVAAGFEVFRVRGERIQLADRVRENLIMDSRVCAVATEPPAVRFTVVAQASSFEGSSESALFEHARALAAEALRRGYVESESAVVPITKPGSTEETLDTWYEVTFEKPTTPEALIEELRYALGLAKTASPG